MSFDQHPSVALLENRLGSGQPKDGTQEAYSWLCQWGLLECLQKQFPQITEEGPVDRCSAAPKVQSSLHNDPSFGKAHGLEEIATSNEKLARKISELHQKYDLVLNIGGDHSSALGSIGGSLKHNPDMKVIWVDAHADFNTPQTSPSGNVHGMPLSFLTRYFVHPLSTSLLTWMPTLKPQNLAMIGLRDLDDQEPLIMKKLNILYYTMEDVHRIGIKAIMQEIFEKLDPQSNSSFHLSFDVDGMDSRLFPSTGTKVENGLNLEQGSTIINQLYQTNRLRAFDLTEVNPQIGDLKELQKSKETAIELFQSFGPTASHIPPSSTPYRPLYFCLLLCFLFSSLISCSPSYRCFNKGKSQAILISLDSLQIGIEHMSFSRLSKSNSTLSAHDKGGAYQIVEEGDRIILRYIQDTAIRMIQLPSGKLIKETTKEWNKFYRRKISSLTLVHAVYPKLVEYTFSHKKKA